MVEGIKNWIHSIAIFLVFSSLIEIIVPEKKYKKYINLILSLIFILIVLDPIIKFQNIELDINKIISENENEINTNDYEVGLVKEKQKELVIQNYKNQLKDQVEGLINNKGFHIEQMDIEIYENKEKKNYGKIKELNLEVSREKNTDNEIVIKNIIVERDINDKRDTRRTDDEIKIVAHISNYYDIPYTSVFVKIVK